MKTLREVISNPSSTHRIPLPLAAAVSLMIAIAPAHAQDGQLQPADEIVNEQPLDQNPELIGEEDIAAEQMTDPATLDEPLQTPDILVDPTIAADPEALLPDEGQAAADGATDLLPAEGEQAVTGGELLPAPDEAQMAVDGATDLLPAEGEQAVTGGELLPAPDEAQMAVDGATDLLPAEGEQPVTGGELLPAPDEAQMAVDGATDLLPAEGEQAVTGGELLPAPDEAQMAVDGATDLLPAEGEQAVTGGELLPPADVEPASADELLAAAADGDNAEPEFETVTIDPNEPKSPAVLPEGVVRIIIQNRSLAPLDVFMDSQDGADPVWVMTLNPGFQATQPSNTGQAWLLAQQDQWKGGFEAGQEPVQRLRFDGGPL